MLGNAVAAAQARGVVIVAAAGNDDVATPQYPANFPGVLGVTAVDENDHKAPFANYGAGAVDIAAPGVGITSTVPISGAIQYAAWSGTSMGGPVCERRGGAGQGAAARGVRWWLSRRS